MSDTATAPASPVGLRGTRGRRPVPGRLSVGDYVGQRAASAAQAVRRAGLRPGLDRSFGCEPDLVGLIVAQEPAAGEEVARNAMVTLYVAAPGSTMGEQDGAEPGRHDRSTPAPSATASVKDTQQGKTPPPQAQRRRQRKPRLAAATSTPALDPPPAPTIPNRARAGLARGRRLRSSADGRTRAPVRVTIRARCKSATEKRPGSRTTQADTTRPTSS